MDVLNAVQWATCLISAAGAFLTAALGTRTKFWGFALFMVSNLLLIGWAAATANHGILATQLVFVASSALGMWNHR